MMLTRRSKPYHLSHIVTHDRLHASSILKSNKDFSLRVDRPDGLYQNREDVIMDRDRPGEAKETLEFPAAAKVWAR